MPLAAFLAGCALWRRDLLLRREAALGVLIAIGLLLPNVIWQITHHWISLDFASSQHAKTASDATPLTYVAQQVAFLGAGAVLVVLGLIWMWRRHHLRPLVLACGAPSILFGLERGRPYYALPAMLPALAAGCLAVAERRRFGVKLSALAFAHSQHWRLRCPSSSRSCPPVSSSQREFGTNRSGRRNRLARARRSTASAWRSRTSTERASSAIVAGSYGAAGALSLFGAAAGLPAPVSGHLSFQYWHPAKMPQHTVLLVGFDYADALRRCVHSTVLAIADNRWHVDNEECGRPIV